MKDIRKMMNLVAQFITKLEQVGLNKDLLQKVITSKNNSLAKDIITFIKSPGKEKGELTELQLFWKILYKKYFNLDIDVSLIQEAEGKWALFIAKGLTIQQVYDALPFNKRKYADGNLDTAVPTNDRTSTKDYVVYVDQNVEADEQFKNKSANDLKKMNHTGITLMDRLVLELKHFEETGNHLNVDNITLFSGSRNSGGGVPNVFWDDGKLRVGWGRTSYLDGYLCSRSVVSA
jgi:hypothetical protein